MKKLNRKGFTLIELLAVIVILAIVMVVTIPSVINSLNDARSRSLQNAASSVAEWFQKNYDISVLSDSTIASVDAAYTTFATTANVTAMTGNSGKELCTTSGTTTTCDAVLAAAGLSNAGNNITSAVVKINSSNKVCVTMTAKEGGNLYSNASGASHTANGGSGC